MIHSRREGEKLLHSGLITLGAGSLSMHECIETCEEMSKEMKRGRIVLDEMIDLNGSLFAIVRCTL